MAVITTLFNGAEGLPEVPAVIDVDVDVDGGVLVLVLVLFPGEGS